MHFRFLDSIAATLDLKLGKKKKWFLIFVVAVADLFWFLTSFCCDTIIAAIVVDRGSGSVIIKVDVDNGGGVNVNLIAD